METGARPKNLKSTLAMTFAPEGGLFGAETTGLDWGAFLGLGGSSPVRAPFNLGGALEAWIPFKGDVELMRLQLVGELATRLGLDVNLQVSAGETRARLPYEVSYSYPEADVLAGSPFFRLEGEGMYLDGPDAGFETDWPYFMFSVDAVFELAVLAQLVAGILGANKTIDLLDFDFSAVLPLIDLDTRPEEELPDDSNVIFGVDLETLDIEATVDFEQKDSDGNVLAEGDAFSVVQAGTSIKAEFKADGVDFGLDQPDKKRKGDAKEDGEEETTKTGSKKQQSVLEKLDEAFDNGPLATLTVNLPSIELEEYGTTSRTRGLDEEVSYLDGTRRAFDYGDGTPADRTGKEMADREDYINDVVNLNIDMDNILVELVKRIFTGGAGAPVIPGLEGELSVPMNFGPLSAGAKFGYNLFDADLEFSLPINQTVEVTPDKLKTSLSFFAADTDGTVKIGDDGLQEATFLTARLPRYSIYFNEANTFWDAGVAEDLRNAQARAVEDSNRVANDLALFVDFEGQQLPGAFTGQTGSIAGGVVMSTDGGDTWRLLTTNAEETAWLARSRPALGQQPDLSKLKPRDDAQFKYVIMTDDTVVTDPDGGGDGTGGIVNLGTVFSHRNLDFSDLVGEKGIFEARLDVVTAPLYSTGLLDGVPSLDLYYPGVPDESIWVEVGHEAGAQVRNDTSLDFNIDIILSALELNLSAWVSAFGARLGLDFDFGPLWTKSYPIFATELAKLYDDTFGLSTRDFIADGADEAVADWGFSVGATGAETVLVTEGTPGDDLLDGTVLVNRPKVNGGSGNDTITFAGVEPPADDPTRGVAADLSQRTDPENLSVQLTPYAERQAGSVHATEAFDTAGMAFEARFSAVIDGESDLLAEGFGLVIRNASDGPSTGDDRGYMGYALQDGGPARTLAVLFDTHPSGEQPGDSSGNQIEIVRDGNLGSPLASVGVATAIADWDDRTLHHYWVTYDGAVLRVYVSRDETRPADPFATAAVNLAAVIGGDAIFGFTASTGAGTQISRHELKSFELDVNGRTELELGALLSTGEIAFGGDAELLYDGDQVLLSVENIDGSRGNDTLDGADSANRIDGGEGDDRISGGKGADTLIGSIGNDILDMGEGPGSGPLRDILLGGEGEDRLIAGPGAALLDGGEDAPVGIGLQDPTDLDIVDYGKAPSALRINLASGEASGPWIGKHELRNIEGIAGPDFNDTLTGDSDRSYFEGGDGNDILIGDWIPEELVALERRDDADARRERLGLEGGNDRLYGQGGNDVLRGGPGADMLDGGDGVDTVDYSWSPTSVFVDLAASLEDLDPELYRPLLVGTGSDDIDYSRVDGQGWRGWAQGDKYRSIERVIGSSYEDILFGTAGNNQLRARSGDDRLAARGGNDYIDAGPGDDIIWTAAQTITVGATFTPENPNVIPEDVDEDYVSNPLGLKANQDGLTALGRPVDEIIGSAGRDLVILDWTGRWIIEQQNELVEVYEDGTEEVIDYGLRYEVGRNGFQDPVARLVGSLAEGIAALEFLPATYTESELAWTDYKRGNADWVEVSYGETADYLFKSVRFADTLIDLRGGEGSYFRNASDRLVIEDPVRVTIATLDGIEGLIGSEHADELTGSENDDYLYGNGNADLIGADDGDDVVSFGAGQPPQQIFSFPGRGYANVTAYDPPDGVGGEETGDDDPGRGPGGGGGGTPNDVPIDPFLPPDGPTRTAADGASNPQIVARIERHERQTPGDGATLAELRSDLIALNGQYALYALVEGGAGDDTLDLRYDRGLDFLPRDHDRGAYVNLETNYAHVAGQSAMVFGVEAVVGTDASDILFGDERANVIEAGAGIDQMFAGGGVDTLSYANADDAVTVILGANGHLRQRKGDADNDFMSGFEVLLGSQHADTLGLRHVSAALGDSVRAFQDANAFQVIDGGGGDDSIVAMRAGGQFFGGDGDDRFLIRDLDWLASRASAENAAQMEIRGGAGVDRVIVSADDLVDARTVGAATVLDFKDSVRGGAEVSQRVAIWDVEYLEIDGQVVRLKAGDPKISAPASLVLKEDPWSVVRVFDDDGPSRLPDQSGRVMTVPVSGQFSYDIGDGRVVVQAGVTLSPAMIEALVFTPNQHFGIGSGGNAGAVIRAGAEMMVRYPVVDADRQPVRDADGEIIFQERKITVLPGDLDGASLRLGEASDTAADPISVEFGKPFTEQNTPSDRAHLGTPHLGVETETLAKATADVETATAANSRAQADLDVAEARYAQAQVLADRGFISQTQVTVLRTQRDEARVTADQREADLAEAQDALDQAESIAAFDSRTLADALPGSRYGDAQTYTITEIPEGGQIWLTDRTPAVGEDWTELEQLFVGDKVTRPQLDLLAFRRIDGVVSEDDFVSLAPDEILEAVVTRVPDQGFVFSSVSDPGFVDPLAGVAAGYELLEDPDAGTLFYRDVSGERVEVSAGDLIDGAMLPELLFDGDIDRRATRSTPEDLLQEIALLNSPTFGSGDPGIGGSAVPPDPTALALRLRLLSDLPVIDGVTVDLDKVGDSHALPFEKNPGRYAPPAPGAPGILPAPAYGISGAVDWVQWRAEDGGNGHFYALANIEGSDSYDRISPFLSYWNGTLGAGTTDLGARPLQLASVGSAAENEFIWNLFGDDADNFIGRLGPRIGGVRTGDDWTWTDRSDWEITLWAPGEPNDSDGIETTVNYILPASYDDLSLVPPLWNDTTRAFAAPGFILEVPAMTSERNDSVTGSEDADRIDGGGGDDVLRGAAGNDTLAGGSGDDVIDGGDGDDRMTGGSGKDIFVMERDGGNDTVTDFTAGDRIDVEGLGLLGLAELRVESGGFGVRLHSGDTTLTLTGADPALFVGPASFVGGTLFVGASVPDAEARALSRGDRMHPDELPGLRFRSDQDATGDAGSFDVQLRDPWDLSGGLAALPGVDPRSSAENGNLATKIPIRVTASNDAPRAADRAYLVSAGVTLNAFDAEIALSATDPEGDALSFSVAEGPLHGALNLRSDGTFSYRPDKGFVGAPEEAADDSFRYRVSDGTDSVVRTVRLDIQDTSKARAADPDAEPNDEGYIEIGGLTSNDWLLGTMMRDHMVGGHGDDFLVTYDGPDLVEGNAGNDTLVGNSGSDTLDGGTGSDLLDGGFGDDDLTGGGQVPLAAGGLNSAIRDFGATAGGWRDQTSFPRLMGDIDGDGAADIVGFGGPSTFSALSDGTGTFASIERAIGNFAKSQGWRSNDDFPRLLGDVNGDGMDDIVGFGARQTFTALSNGDGTFGDFQTAVSNFSRAQAWASNDAFPRIMGDIDGDGVDDIIGFGIRSTFTALGNGDGTFAPAKRGIDNFSAAQGWSDNTTFLRLSGDVNGDGMDDIIGFGAKNTFTALSNGDGTFGNFQRGIDNFAKAQGWGNNDATPRLIGDFNGDGIDDIIGFGGPSSFVALGVGNGTFAAFKRLVNDFNVGSGWNSFEALPRQVADLDGNGTDDIVGFARNGVLTRLTEATTDIFVFENRFGRDTVQDFDVGADGDRLDFRGLGAFDSLAQVKAAARQDGADTVITDGVYTLRLADIRLNDLTDADFLFG
jgi:Ca2+-binding RTX toxin-like protein